MKRFFLIITAIVAISINATAQENFVTTTPSGHKLYCRIFNATEYLYPEVIVERVDTAIYTGHLIIPDTVSNNGQKYVVVRVQNQAFQNCTGITEVTLPNTLKEISYMSFCGCENLVSINLPDSINSIGTSAFQRCYRLATISMGDAVSVIYGNAFFDCLSLKSVHIGNSVTTIYSNAFNGCASLVSVNVPVSVTYIADNAFGGVKNVNYHGTATGAPWGAVAVNCLDATTGLVFSDSTRTKLIGGIDTITHIVVPTTVKVISQEAFRYNTAITELTVSEQVDTIETDAFICPNLATVNWNALDAYVPSSPFRSSYYYSSNIHDMAPVVSLNIGANVKSIPQYLLYLDTMLTSVTLPDSLVRIGQYAFSGTRISNLILPETIQYIGEGAFYNTLLSSILIPEGIDTIGGYAFSTPTLANVTYNAVDCNTSNAPFSPSNQADIEQTLIIGSQVRSLSTAVFSKMTMTDVTLPASLHIIGPSAFANCNNMSQIVIPDSVTSIGNNAFLNGNPTRYLSRIVIGSSVSEIGNYSFSNLNPDTIFVKATEPPTITSTTFNAMRTNVPIIVPCGTADVYTDAAYWNDMRRIAERDECAANIIATANNTRMGTVDGGGRHSVGSTAKLTAIAYYNYGFAGWVDGNTDNPRFMTVEGDTTIEAIFVPIHDTIYIHDTIEVGIDRTWVHTTKIYIDSENIVIDGANNMNISIYDCEGRLMSQKNMAGTHETFTLPATGIYYVKVGDFPARKIVAVL